MAEKEEQDDDKIVWIACNRAGGAYKSDIEGSTLETCTQCGHEVWISPATLATKMDHQGRVICFPCAMPRIEASLKKKDLDLLVDPRQVTEIQKTWDEIKRSAPNN
jgi:superfamily II helicase